ncbi:putative 39S ribosomal protein, partial [Naja naja]
ITAVSSWSKRVCETGWLPALQLICSCFKSVTHHWKPMHIMKEKLMAVTEHIPPKPLTSETYMNPPGESACFFSVMTSHTSRLLQRGSVHLCSLLVLYIQQQNEKVEEKLDGNISYTGSSLILQ